MDARWSAISRLLESDASRKRRLQNAFETVPARMIFVCHGNIMRSAFAQVLFRETAPGHRDRILGAGTHAKNGRPAQDSAISVAEDFGISLANHCATNLESIELADGDVIICMDRANEANTIARFGWLKHRVFLIGDATSSHIRDRTVTDPYAKGDGATKAAFIQIEKHVKCWRESLERSMLGAKVFPQ